MLTTHVERVLEAYAECVALTQEHYRALSLHQFHGYGLAPRLDAYAARDAAGEVLCVTLRDGGRIVGYFIGFLSTGMHYGQCLMLVTDMFFVAQSHRGRHGGIKLFRRVMQEARARGVKLFMTSHKTHEPEAGRLFALLGFEETEKHYSLWLEDA